MMTEFYQEDYRIRSVRIGEQSSLPGLEGLANVQQNTKAVLAEDDEIFLGYGFRSNVFPYRPQDVYTREQTERCYRSIVLENEFSARAVSAGARRTADLADRQGVRQRSAVSEQNAVRRQSCHAQFVVFRRRGVERLDHRP